MVSSMGPASGLPHALREYLRWVFATSVGWALGLAFPALFSSMGDRAGEVGVFTQMFMVPAVGLGIGVGQAFVLERFTRGGGSWAACTALGVPLGTLAGLPLMILLTPRWRPMPDWAFGAAPGLCIGLACGAFQAAWLRRRAAPPRLVAAWVAATAAGWVAAVLCARALTTPWLGIPEDSIGTRPAVPLPLFLLAWLLTGWALGTILGAVAGAPLPAVLRRLEETRETRDDAA